ncbi:Isy1-like splicing factor [Kockovaella imperatae]|uniref:Isy1-like splicing factor n=1 Tax=Kockovaella imperatae TaxID=4999 RepID=A0A1Y1U5Z9_9TREE|nr:Isy1-like splicing factor [Kockovaella imperatae]ORX33453.1 Isy1-like splicing factor [Kockovaella imperatae]
MARNSEKAQSMLYRFRESQAIEMGMGNRMKGERRPRMASSVTSLRDCERFRGDILREISRKVSKIQDATLTDYQVRDLNDEINGLMREKRHFENQIVSLGGANYKRGNQAMLDEDGKEVPGTRGYKYFGRAKDLPGVKEMFTKSAQQATEESARNASFQMFRHQGPDYYGDVDDVDGGLLEEEDKLAREEWDAAVARTSATLSVDGTIPYPLDPTTKAGTKRKAKGKPKSRSKRKTGENDAIEEDEGEEDGEDISAAISATFGGVLDAQSLHMPEVPTREQMGEILLEVRKKALREEYGV